MPSVYADACAGKVSVGLLAEAVRISIPENEAVVAEVVRQCTPSQALRVFAKYREGMPGRAGEPNPDPDIDYWMRRWVDDLGRERFDLALDKTTGALFRQAWDAARAAGEKTLDALDLERRRRLNANEIADRFATMVLDAAGKEGLTSRGGEKYSVQIVADLEALAEAMGIELDLSRPVKLGTQCFIPATGQRLSARELARVMCDASVQLLITHKGAPLWLGNEARTANRYQRRALRFRSGGPGGCEFPGHAGAVRRRSSRAVGLEGGTDRSRQPGSAVHVPPQADPRQRMDHLHRRRPVLHLLGGGAVPGHDQSRRPTRRSTAGPCSTARHRATASGARLDDSRHTTLGRGRRATLPTGARRVPRQLARRLTATRGSARVGALHGDVHVGLEAEHVIEERCGSSGDLAKALEAEHIDLVEAIQLHRRHFAVSADDLELANATRRQERVESALGARPRSCHHVVGALPDVPSEQLVGPLLGNDVLDVEAADHAHLPAEDRDRIHPIAGLDAPLAEHARRRVADERALTVLDPFPLPIVGPDRHGLIVPPGLSAPVPFARGHGGRREAAGPAGVPQAARPRAQQRAHGSGGAVAGPPLRLPGVAGVHGRANRRRQVRGVVRAHPEPRADASQAVGVVLHPRSARVAGDDRGRRAGHRVRRRSRTDRVLPREPRMSRDRDGPARGLE
ncbi:MAG: hypothetical protein EHM63_00015 [Actinobacteria bacterium]|nr:MAG: hypothetical protein EHM63_00015 [Actinomycetota bacterium]